jgi:hypothetical protein
MASWDDTVWFGRDITFRGNLLYQSSFYPEDGGSIFYEMWVRTIRSHIPEARKNLSTHRREHPISQGIKRQFVCIWITWYNLS